jgi:hypothetical protein
MKTLATTLFFFLCTLFAVGQNQFAEIDRHIAQALISSADTMMRCTLIPRKLQDQHDEFHNEDSCQYDYERNLYDCIADHVIVLDIPRYQEIQIVVPITDTLEKIFREFYGNSMMRLQQSPKDSGPGFGLWGPSHTESKGFAGGRFVDLYGNVLSHNVYVPDMLAREIIYRWIAQREVCVIAIGKPKHEFDLIDEIYDVLSDEWYLVVDGVPSRREIPRDKDQYRWEEGYVLFSMMDNFNVRIKVE